MEEKEEDPKEIIKIWKCTNCKIQNDINVSSFNNGFCYNKSNGSGLCHININDIIYRELIKSVPREVFK